MTRRSTASAALAVLATLMLASNVTAAPPDWGSTVDLRLKRNVFLSDTDMAGMRVAATWEETKNGTPRVGFRTSTNSGDSFGPPEYITNSTQSRLDLCSSNSLYAAYTRDVGGGHTQIADAVRSVGGSGFSTDLVWPNAANQHDPDIACAGGRVFVSWFEPEGAEGDRLFVANARRSNGVFGAPLDLGLDNQTMFGSSLAVAGVPGNAYVVFALSNGDLRFMRWTIGDGPGLPVTNGPIQVIADATANNSADGALVDADGSKVVVAWSRCGGLFARVSNDYGETWGPIRKLLRNDSCGGDFAAGWSSIAVDGDRIAAVWVGLSAFGGGSQKLLETTTDFANVERSDLGSGTQFEHMVGFLNTSDGTKLGAVFNPRHKILFRREM